MIIFIILLTINSISKASDDLPIISSIYDLQSLSKLFFIIDDKITKLDPFVVKINEVNSYGMPKDVSFIFNKKEIENRYIWKYWDWKLKQLVTLKLPKEGEEKIIWGPF